jgi:hypothetical protein
MLRLPDLPIEDDRTKTWLSGKHLCAICCERPSRWAFRQFLIREEKPEPSSYYVRSALLPAKTTSESPKA